VSGATTALAFRNARFRTNSEQVKQTDRRLSYVTASTAKTKPLIEFDERLCSLSVDQ
jgi:hypothetical protein